MVFFASGSFCSLISSFSTLSGSCPSPNAREFSRVDSANGNCASQWCKAISAARTVREQCFLEARSGWEDKMVLCRGKWNLTNPGSSNRRPIEASTKAHSQFVHCCPVLTQETISTLRKGGSVLIPADVAGWIPEAER